MKNELSEKEIKMLNKMSQSVGKELKKKSTKKVEKKSTKKIAKKAAKKTAKHIGHSKPECATGKFKSIRNLLETLFAKNKDLSKEDADVAVKKHFPKSQWVKVGTHFTWYKSHIVNRGEFLTITAPKWASGGAKIKKSTKK